MSKKSKKKLKKKERQVVVKSALSPRASAKSAKKTTAMPAHRNGHAAAKAKKGKLVYYFGDGRSDGDGKMKALLGGKGANLAEMTRIGLPVPPGFTITTEVCTWFNAHNKALPKEIDAQIEDAVARIEKSLGKGFGSLSNPLLFAVRSGARDSMPGMMDTILNLGLNDETVQGLVAASDNERFAFDCYRRFIQMYGDVVMGVQKRRLVA
jgi:pyruvate,orthophosphate dikinase